MTDSKVQNFLKEILTEEEYQEVGNLPHVQDLYSEKFIDSVEVIPIENKRFLIRKADKENLPEHWKETLIEVTRKENDTLLNPVYVELDKDGTLLLD